MQRTVRPTSGALRATNRANIVEVLRRAGSATRTELMEQTGLSRATVSSVVGELQRQGLVSERRPGGPSGFGRPPGVVALNRSAGLAIAVDVGVRHLAVAVGDLSRRVLAERWVTLPHGHRADAGTALVLDSIDEALSEAEADVDQIVGAAISLAAPIAPDSGQLLVPGVLPGWNGRDLAHAIGVRWDIPVALENDANLGALGEAVFEHGSSSSGLLYVKVASRVGLGLAFGNRIHRGRNGYAGELGHLTVDPSGERCWCGRVGCLELYAGGEGMLGRLSRGRAAITSLGELVSLAGAGDPDVCAVVDEGASVLARGIATLALLLDPERVVVGGELTALGDLLLAPIRRELASIPFGPTIDIGTAALGERASLVGGLALVLSESGRFSDRSSTPHPQRGLAAAHRSRSH